LWRERACLGHLVLHTCLAWLVACAQAADCTSAPPGLVSWWRGENSTADAVGGNIGTIAGTGAVTYGPGVVGQAFVFDGTHRDRIDLGNPVSLQLQVFTLEAWVKRSSPTVTSFDVLGADGSVAGDGACIIGYGRGGYILAVANDGRLILSRTDMDGVTSTPLITDVNWHHLAVTKAGTNAVFYVDGQAQATPIYVPSGPYTFDDATCSCNAAIAIGSRGDARGGTFYGAIDEATVFNRALSASEIQAIYNAGSAGKCPPNNWTNPVSAKWESPSWSLGKLPASDQTVAIMNDGYKAVNIDSATVSDFPSSLTGQNLEVSAPPNSLSTLLLNYFGLNTPLRVVNSSLIGTNGTILNLSSSFEVDGAAGGALTIDGGTFTQEGGLTVVTAPVQVQNGTLNATNATMNLGPLQVGGGYPQYGAIYQSGGTILSSAISIGRGEYSLLTSGTLYALSGTHLNDPEASFIQTGGSNYGDVHIDQGYYTMQGGLLQGTNVQTITLGGFNQNGGTVAVQNVSVRGLGTEFSIFPSYVLNTGMLACATLKMSNYGIFHEAGGTLVLTNGLNLLDPSGPQVGFELFGGNAFMPSLIVSNGGDYLQYGGTNDVSGDLLLYNSAIAIYGGRLSAANMGIGKGARVYQQGGTNEISEVLSITGAYALEEGSLSVNGVYMRGTLAINNLEGVPPVLNNTGLINFGGTLAVSVSQNSMGQLGLSANGTISLGNQPLVLRFADSSLLNWDSNSQLTIEGWNGSYSGNSSNQIYFGNSSGGLTPSQLSQVTFLNPAGAPPGNSDAQILSSGEVVPVAPVIGPALQSLRSGEQLVLTWSANYQLLSATNVLGPYAPVSGASPYTNEMGGEHQRFFRLQGQ
jgi:hypothetical protein